MCVCVCVRACVRVRACMRARERACEKGFENSVYSDFCPVGNGVKQGGTLSPLLFNIYMTI